MLKRLPRHFAFNQKPQFGGVQLAVLCGFLIVASALYAQAPDPTIQRLQGQIDNLEKRQQIVLEAMEKAYTQGLWFIGIAVALTTLLSAIRYVQDQRLLKDAQELGKSYKTNIETTNDLMISIKGALDYYKNAQEIEKKVNELKDLQSETVRHSESQMAVLNDTAMELSQKCNRNSHNDPAIQRLARDFRAQYEILERSSRTSEQLNANGHFVLGFHHRIENDYDAALKEFEAAERTAGIDMTQPSHPSYRKLPPGISLSTWLTKLINICAFHRAIINANLGEYEKAKQCFEIALTHDPLDYQSLSYVPETMFLGGIASFSRIVSDFRAAISTVEGLTADQERDFAVKKSSLLGLLYLKLSNCYMAESPNSDYKTHRDLAEAESLVRTALIHDPSSLFGRLSLAQLLHKSNREATKRRDLFVEVFVGAKAVVSSKTEAKILMMYYYMMLICCTLGEIPGEAPGAYVTRIFELVPRLPKPLVIRIFSPFSKTDLTVTQFTNEVQGFEASLSSEVAPIRSSLPTPVTIPARPQPTTVGRSLLEGV